MVLRDVNEIRELFPFESDEELYLLVALARGKHNPHLNKQIVLKKIVHSSDEWTSKILHLSAEARCHPYRFQLYVTFNPASARKAYKFLKEKFAEWDYRNDLLHIKRVESEWMSLLQTPEATARRQYYLIDVDSREADDRIQPILHSLTVVAEAPTFNGKHYLVKPFDVRILSGIDEVEVKKNALFVIGQIEP